jgi:hypothetical protein
VKHASLAALMFAAAATFASSANATILVKLIPGTYHLSNSGSFGPAVDTLDVTVSGGIGYFTLSGADNLSFSLPDMVEPSFIGYGPAPVYKLPFPNATASWNTAAYPYVFLFREDLVPGPGYGGGIGVSADLGYAGPILVDTYESGLGSGQVFRFVDTPEPITLALFGVGLAGAVAFRRRGSKAAAI